MFLYKIVHDIQKLHFHEIDNFKHFWNLNQMFYFTAFMYASRKGRIDIIREFISHKDIDINIKNIYI